MTYRYKIIDASAGTGKTFSLRKNILLKLLSNDNFSFKQILALTFTNKASNEMKQAILFDLYQISNNPKDSDVFVEIEKLKKITNVKFKAQKILTESILSESPELIETIISNPEVRRFGEELWKDVGRLLTDSQEGKSEEIINFVKTIQEKISKNVDLNKSYKKLSSMISKIEK